MAYNSKNLSEFVPHQPSTLLTMGSSIRAFAASHPGLLFLFPYSFLLIFLGLGDGSLQVDEGMDTFISTTILKYGVPMHSDGVNATMLFADIYDGLFIYRTWLPYYLQAFSLEVFGHTTFAARLPFALVGIASVIALYFLALKLTGNKITAFLAALLLSSSVPALIYFRTARYVGLPILLTILLIYFYIRIFEDKQWKSYPFIIIAILYFHSMYVAFAGIILGILIHFCLHRKKIRHENARLVPRCALIIGVFTLPWMVSIIPAFSHIAQSYVDRSDLVDNSFVGLFKHFAGYLFQINNYIFPVILLPLLFIKQLKPFKLQIQLLLICTLTLLTASSPHSIPMQQYISAAFPLLTILLAMILTMSMRKNFWVPTILSGILIFTNLLHIGPLLPLKFFMQQRAIAPDSQSVYLNYASQTFFREVRLASVFTKHLYQISHPYRGPLDKIVEFFKTHGNARQTCYIDNEPESLAFYTGMKVYANETLNVNAPPDWIVLRGDQRMLDDGPGSIKRTLKTILANNPYRKLSLETPALRNNNSYDIQLHRFRSPEFTTADKKVLIYQRMNDSAASERGIRQRFSFKSRSQRDAGPERKILFLPANVISTKRVLTVAPTASSYGV
ncbi:MAG: glycosyltransferase family 39 protein [Nitrospinae bacterium]|nr:glycosyltransferase family 39 protein [Nitrospinota bacterium]